jgi:AcrR family transcriptional regulator
MVTKPRLARSAPDIRRSHILKVARDAFMEEGFAATSMSTIAARLGGSKATLYKYFPSKEQLFEEMMAESCAAVLAALRKPELPHNSVRALLRAYGSRCLRALFTQDALNLIRLIYAEGARFPEVGRTFFENGPDLVIQELAKHLTQLARRGLIRCADPLSTAHQFLGMILGNSHMRVACGLAPMPTEADFDAQVEHAVELIAPGLATADGFGAQRQPSGELE